MSPEHGWSASDFEELGEAIEMASLRPRQLLGLPQKISFQILYGRQLEQWNYDRPSRLWLVFLCTKTHIPTLQTVRLSSDKGIKSTR